MKQKIFLTKQETEKLIPVLEKLEQDTMIDTGVSKISGGFASADMFNYDEDYIDVELKWGVQSDVEDSVHTEQYKVNRKTFKIED